MNRISFAAWIQISGPTFAAMVFGFALLWNAQQVTSAQLMEHGRAMGRLEGSIAGLERSVAGVERSVAGVERSVEALNSRLDRLSASVERLAERIAGGGAP